MNGESYASLMHILEFFKKTYLGVRNVLIARCVLYNERLASHNEVVQGRDKARSSFSIEGFHRCSYASYVLTK